MRYAFRLDKFNDLAGVFEPFQLLFFSNARGEDEIEINDLKRKRRFLARTVYPGLRLSDLRLGARVTM
jgi:hypothetical protein